MKKSLFFLLFLIAFSSNCYSQFTPSIHNYTLAEYKAGNQNWDISRADNGKVYVANNSGLLEYDALVWKFYPLPNKTIVRSVLAVDDIVYTGSYEEFGYWKHNDFGVLKYFSLSEMIPDLISPNEEIWEIISFNGKIIFRSFLNIYIYDFENVIQLRPGSVIISCSVVEDNTYVSTLNEGVFLLKGNTLEPFYFNNKLLDTKIISINKYQGKLLLMTSLKGSFFLDNDQLVPTNFEINEQIQRQQLNEFSVLANGDMVFGTIKDGVYLTDNSGKSKFHISKENGLFNNTILGQSVDNTGNLWLGLDNGIANIELNSSNYFFNDVSGKLGAVYDVVKFKEVIYIGSNTGLFWLDDNEKLQFIEGSQGQVWDLEVIEDQLFCGHNEGTFIVDKDQFTNISSYTGGWTIKKVPEREHTYIQGTYSGLVKFEKISGEWHVKHLGKTTIPSRFLVFENPHTAWVAHATKGVYKVNFDDDYNAITAVKDYHDKGISSNYNVRVYNIRNNISFKSNEGWQKYEPILDSIVPYELLNNLLGKNSYIISDDNTDLIALKNKDGFIKFKSFDSKNDEFFLNDVFLKNRYIVGYENVSRVNDSNYALNLDNGFMVINSTPAMDTNLYKPNIESILISDSSVNLTDIDNGEIEFKFKESITIELSSSKSLNHFFEYSISEDNTSEDDVLWSKIDGNKVEFSNLIDGDHVLSFRASDNAGNVSPVQLLEIEVYPPWYRDTLGYFLYFLLAGLIIFIFYTLHNKKIVKEQRLIKIKYQKEQQKLLREQTLENEKRIIQLKNESLQNEIKLKSKQLANNAMALVKKNETLQDIKKDLMVNKDGFNNYYSYKKIVKKLDNSIVLKDEWEVFENNFSQVHDEFFEVLKAKHEVLTPKDLKICAYIKMNLSSKEIAPLMNISVRGVETHRYRLKKKLNLENDISLVDYLLNIKN
ncbi:helix-turn-helix and ligand-binding sensor domain-containing protein [Winogradskyella psychrotolerans]|uniref:helix-turn-helix and ligand-binding sensor domain-containing protein n=1 Tax=Winogradskyella psychrotolerans TaxID=1344585 RepID=UPI001C0715DB|nr:LuxR C-terminal-related transcriptional regulator [Winogradskyella psychrotolerans]MBU2927668.1 LuxR C-terminal-related transcriptional regulator [Winogradskyella psychrotolerans]